ncbi:penicillin-binding protein 2 [Modestobacter sp. NPDC049651]|uniref:peptidoglycan D,D-transpeptidase FtsI family protein n=1 Tax=unclassified Modestobacter TaxID=2643866 RepID=UPI0033C92575
MTSPRTPGGRPGARRGSGRPTSGGAGPSRWAPPGGGGGRTPRTRGLLSGRGRERRHRLGLGFMVLLLVVVVGKLVVLQGVDSASYAQAAENSRMRSFPITAVRGEITDTKGAVLAYSVDAEKVVVDPTLITDKERTALALTTLLDVPVPELTEKLSAKGRYSVLAEHVPTDVTDQVRDLGYGGVFFEDDPVRLYPAGAVGGQIVGFVGRDGAGLAGIESKYQDLLAGKDGENRFEVDGSGNRIPSGIDDTTPAVDGGSVQLTIDEDLQYVVQQRLDAACADGQTTSASAVALDVHTGQVAAMASCPGYDPAHYNTTDPDLLGNPTVSDVYEPGSVMKAVTMSAALEEGKATPDTVLTVPGHIQAGDKVVRDATDHAPRDYTVTGVLAHSSNVGTIMLAREVGDSTLEKYLRAFGLGSRTGVELPGESAGILEDSKDWTASRAANVPIGQGISVTTLQLASVYQTIANDGVRIPPRIVKSVTAHDGTVRQEPQPAGTRVISQQTADSMAYMLESVTSAHGTAPKARIDGFRVAGKTGTAQRANPETGSYVGGGYFTTFVGFAPADDPQYVIAVDLERPTSSAEGGQVAAPVFADLMRYALTTGGVVPSGAPTPDFVLEKKP